VVGRLGVDELEVLVTPNRSAKEVAEAGVVNIVAVMDARDAVASYRSDAYTSTVVVVVELEYVTTEAVAAAM